MTNRIIDLYIVKCMTEKEEIWTFQIKVEKWTDILREITENMDYQENWLMLSMEYIGTHKTENTIPPFEKTKTKS